MPLSRRLMFISTASLIGIGIGLTGWKDVHWFLYVPPILLGVFGITGLCPAILMGRLRNNS